MINFEYTRVSSVKAAVDALSKNPTGGFFNHQQKDKGICCI